MNDLSVLFFIVIIASAIFNLFTVFELSKLPAKDHRYKRYWTNIVLFLPVFGALLYYLNKRNVTNEND
ncbi:PLDc N-terminal domain-containing protein [Pedobacter sp. MC2016-24]|uniref:PLDc N-terminal domain-containing protein n=1 Tax=Pedobacter sp. MC2016-24 TaxID=2780090 RepID=UPI0018811EA8|nr:PLDc N-terminal domain-containing protein [Pedobacter sp. MC2016-24]MBE9601906.1 PLDc N-terminal domain-containing protein [Pedobacter sp. MC2016-24]